jgi:hypothetical protein
LTRNWRCFKYTPGHQLCPKASNAGLIADSVDMPGVGLTTTTESLDPSYRVVIKYSVEFEGLPVYNERYDLAKITGKMKRDADAVLRLWFRPLQCVVEARHQPAFSAHLTCCLTSDQQKEE